MPSEHRFTPSQPAVIQLLSTAQIPLPITMPSRKEVIINSIFRHRNSAKHTFPEEFLSALPEVVDAETVDKHCVSAYHVPKVWDKMAPHLDLDTTPITDGSRVRTIYPSVSLYAGQCSVDSILKFSLTRIQGLESKSIQGDPQMVKQVDKFRRTFERLELVACQD
jgi:hypothetical protein